MKRKLFALCIVLLVGGLLAVLVLRIRSQQPVVSESLRRKINYPLYIGSSSKDAEWKTSASDVSYDNSEGVTTVILRRGEDRITFKQQATPEPFSDVPNYYSKLLDKMQQYASIQTNKGSVTLTRPKETNGLQVASANPQGTLITATPSKELTNQEWIALFNNLEVIR